MCYRHLLITCRVVSAIFMKCFLLSGVVSFKDKLYVIGGVSMTEDASNSSKVILDCIQCYDPLTDKYVLIH